MTDVVSTAWNHLKSKVHVYKPLGDRDPLLLAYFVVVARASFSAPLSHG